MHTFVFAKTRYSGVAKPAPKVLWLHSCLPSTQERKQAARVQFPVGAAILSCFAIYIELLIIFFHFSPKPARSELWVQRYAPWKRTHFLRSRLSAISLMAIPLAAAKYLFVCYCLSVCCCADFCWRSSGVVPGHCSDGLFVRVGIPYVLTTPERARNSIIGSMI